MVMVWPKASYPKLALNLISQKNVLCTSNESYFLCLREYSPCPL